MIFAKALISILLLLILSFNLKAQSAEVVFESTLRIGGLSDEIFYFGFAEGDQLVFDFDVAKNRELKEIEISEWPTATKYMDYKVKKVSNKILTINKTAVYKFRFSNSALKERVCKIKIQRIPLNATTQKFNSSVYWETINDTSFYLKDENYLKKVDTSFVDFYSSNPKISSQTAMNGNLNYQILDFDIPENTVSWSFYIATGKEGQEKFDQANIEFYKVSMDALIRIPGYGPMAALALTGISYISKSQSEDNVKYWFLNDINDTYLFKQNQAFMQYKKGDVVSEACQMKYPLKGKVYLAVKNDNIRDAIVLTIRCTAVVVKEIWDVRQVRKFTIKTRKEPVLKN